MNRYYFTVPVTEPTSKLVSVAVVAKREEDARAEALAVTRAQCSSRAIIHDARLLSQEALTDLGNVEVTVD